jgi:hypothetical protein
VVGIAAVGDFIVTVPEMLGRPLPDVLFVSMGGFKVPFAMAWRLIIGVALIISPPERPASPRIPAELG